MKQKQPKPDAYGFVRTFDGCKFAHGLHMADLTITAPDGCKLGLNMSKLIAAAPDLLAELQVISIRLEKVLRWHGSTDAQIQTHPDLNRAAALILKAKGIK